ncbi:Nitrate reductase gamma subunit domain-containing protein [Desulfonema limicola]|uniref:Nitrate reductase gamma subunit domain-containing protein n=1 Tax=Desulfonema limicola TaxID=45656 RepID=A0A975BA30_9BACT|nr:heterodisulfide reductase-related iron-sulfur binding cluster [Desulfonema limicola]QTA81452.1 Nitrate reductase gamma subunit domain-containing protein [Desulfonema limicola]
MKSLITSFDTLLIAAAFIIMIMGLFGRWSLWREKKDKNISGDWGRVKNYLVKHSEILKRPNVGAAHMAVFWGFVLPVTVIILAQFSFSMPGVPALMLSFLQEAAGIAMLAGTVYLFIRRIQSQESEGPKRTVIPMFIMLIILVSGFLAEASRLRITGTGSAWASPLGWMLSFGTPSSPLFMQLMIRVHFFAVLLFIASIPFTFMRHLAASPLNIFYKKQGPKAALREIQPEIGEIGAKTAGDFSWKQLLETEACVSCGRCEENCPAAISGKSLSPRKIIRKILEQAEAAACQECFISISPKSLLEETISQDEIWACTTCMACVEHCPVFVEAMDKIVDMRRYQVMGRGNLPYEARPMIRDLELYGDVQGKGSAHRADWAMNRDVPAVGNVKDAEVLFWVGCSGAFHPRNKETALAMVKILKAADINFGILAQEELCCGDPARRLGEETLYQKLAKQNIDKFKKYNIKKILTLCPHCLNTLKNEYPELGCSIPVVHATEFVMDLITRNKIKLKYPVADKIAVHDACYLGRYNEVYQPPRDICRAVPGVQLKELKRNRENAFCCGGGGGRMWLHENTGTNINLIRAREIAESDLDMIGTSCPYCLVMLDDGVKSLEKEKIPVVADIIDIVADAIK